MVHLKDGKMFLLVSCYLNYSRCKLSYPVHQIFGSLTPIDEDSVRE
jgi:hypothetical protein